MVAGVSPAWAPILALHRYEDREKAVQELERVNAMVSAHKAHALTRDLFHNLTCRTLPEVPLKTALDDWIKEATGYRAEDGGEIHSASTDLVGFFKASDQGPKMSDITREDLQRYLSERRSTVTAARQTWPGSVWPFSSSDQRHVDLSKTTLLKASRCSSPAAEEKHIRRPFTFEELGALYRQAPDDFWRYMVLAGFFTGLRLGDLATMPIGAVDFKTRNINILTRKTGQRCTFPFPHLCTSLMERLKVQRKGSLPTDPWWPEKARLYEELGAGPLSNQFYELLLVPAGMAAVRTHLQAKKGRAGKRKVNAISFHCFRHSYVSTLAALGHNQQIVKALSDTPATKSTTSTRRFRSTCSSRPSRSCLTSRSRSSRNDQRRQENAFSCRTSPSLGYGKNHNPGPEERPQGQVHYRKAGSPGFRGEA